MGTKPYKKCWKFPTNFNPIFRKMQFGKRKRKRGHLCLLCHHQRRRHGHQWQVCGCGAPKGKSPTHPRRHRGLLNPCLQVCLRSRRKGLLQCHHYRMRRRHSQKVKLIFIIQNQYYMIYYYIRQYKIIFDDGICKQHSNQSF